MSHNTVFRSLERPEMISTYVSFAGMLHVHENEFGSDFLFYITDKLNLHLQMCNYREIKYIVNYKRYFNKIYLVSIDL